MDSSFQEASVELFKTIALLLFYPFGCCLWIYLCRKHGVAGRKQYLFYGLGGLCGWALMAFAFFEPKPWRISFLIVGAAVYFAYLVFFVRLSLAKVKEIETRQQMRYTTMVKEPA